MHRTRIALRLIATPLLAACFTLGGCASLLPIAGAIVLKEAADRYEKDQTTRTARASGSAGTRTSGIQPGETPDVKAPEGSMAAKVSNVPTSAEGAETSATESSARILATAIKRVPTPSAEPVHSTKPVRD
jgi:hypothetical protein